MMVSVEVEIFGTSYVIKTDSDPQYVRELAEFVNKKMKEIESKSQIVSTQKIAILTSMNIADELFKLKREGCSPDTLKLIETKTEYLSKLINSVDVT